MAGYIRSKGQVLRPNMVYIYIINLHDLSNYVNLSFVFSLSPAVHCSRYAWYDFHCVGVYF